MNSLTVLSCVTVASFVTTSSAMSEISKTAISLGLSPQVLAACGLSTGQAGLVMSNLSSASELREQLAAAKAAQSEALQAQQEAFAHRLANPDDETAAGNLRAAINALSTAREQVVQIRALLLSEALDGLSETERSRIHTALQPANTGLPAEFRVVEWTEAERAALRSALAEEQRVQVRGGTLSSLADATLSASRTRSETAAASIALQVNLSAIQQVFEGS